MDTKNVIAAITLSSAIIILWSLFMIPEQPQKKDLVEKIQNIETKFRSGQEKIQADLQKVQSEELSRIRAIVEKAITDYAEKNDFDIIIRADGTTLYAKKYINITQEIISKLQ